MNFARIPLRIAQPGPFTLRITELLWNGAAHTTLDALAQPLYRSAMNYVERPPEQPSTDVAPAEAGGALFAFLAAADQLYERISEALARVGLSYAKYEVLKHLRDARGPLSLGSLAAAQSCARSNITQLVDRLETEGLVRRVDDPADRRGVRAELTPLGYNQVEEGATQIDLVRAQFAASFSAPERAELLRLLGKIR